MARDLTTARPEANRVENPEIQQELGYMAGFRAKVIHVCLSVVDSSFYYIRENSNITKINHFRQHIFLSITIENFATVTRVCFFFHKLSITIITVLATIPLN